jgi:hypothetical protein
MANMEQVEMATAVYAAGRAILEKKVMALKAEEDKLKKKHLPMIRVALNAAKVKYGMLLDMIQANKDLFKRPKTVIFNGIKVGFRKQKGKITWEDDAQVVRLIRKHFPDQESVLIITTETPSKEALEALTAADLKKIGVRVGDDEDKPVIKNADSELDKLIDALFKDEEREREEA